MAPPQRALAAPRIDVRIAPPFRAAVRAAWLRSIARRVLAVEGVAGPAHLGIVIADDETVRDLSHRFLGLDEPTDVLSFGLSAAEDAPFALPPEETTSLGEVVIAYPTAVRQAEEAGRLTEAEVAHLLVHGVLHLLGYDHQRPDDERAMRGREEQILAGLAASVGPFERLHGGL
jgi:probable rRNA maturation factor